MGRCCAAPPPGADSRRSRCSAAIITGAYTRKYSFTACSICYSHCISWDKLGISTDTSEQRKDKFRHKIEVMQKILQKCPEFFNDRIKESATAAFQLNLMDKNSEHEG